MRERREGFVSGAEKRCRFIEHDGDGDVAQQALEFPLVAECLEEGTVLDFFDDFYGYAAGNIDAAERENLEGKVACFGAVDGRPEIESVSADGALFGETEFGDFGCGIGAGILEGVM